MFKNLFIAASIITMTLFLAPACAEQDKDADASVSKTQTEGMPTPAPASEATMAETTTGDEPASVMDLPVDFSTPEDVEKSIEKVRQQAGEAQARDLTNALGYILAYDLSFGRDKEKMYKKLNGRTPSEIIAKMKR